MPGFLTTASGMTVCGNSTASCSGRMPIKLAGTIFASDFVGMRLGMCPLYQDMEFRPHRGTIRGSGDRQRDDQKTAVVTSRNAFVFHRYRQRDALDEIAVNDLLLREGAAPPNRFEPSAGDK